jgi:hypothetical protein
MECLDEKIHITLDCNDTGYGNDDYTIDFCNINCMKNYKLKLEIKYDKGEIDLDESSEYYMMNKYLNSKKEKK